MRKDSKIIYYLILIGFFGIFSTTISKNPVLPLFMKKLGASETIIGLISAISPFAGVIFSFPVGLLSDKIGIKKLLITSGLIFLTAPLLYLFINSALWLIPIRFFHGIATAILGPVSASIILSTYDKDKAEKLGTYSSVTLIGRTLAPLIGGVLISYFAFFNNLWNYKIVYFVAFILAIPVFISTLLISNKKKSNIKEVNIWQNIIYLFKEKRVLSTALIEMTTYFAFGVLETYLPLYLLSHGVEPQYIGVIFSIQIVSIALSKPLFGRLADRIDKRVQILTGIIITGLSIGFISLFPNIIYSILMGILFGLGLSISTVATSTYLSEVVDKTKLGASLGGLNSIMDIGQSIGPLITGIIIQATSFFTGFLASSILVIIVVLIFILSNYKKEYTIKPS